MENKVLFFRIVGWILIFIGLSIVFLYGGASGFSLGLVAAIAYIGGFILAFIGAYYAFRYGKVKELEY